VRLRGRQPGLRARMGLAAGVAVALAVIAVAVSAYAGTSSELHGQLDQALRSLTSQAIGGPGGGGPGQGDPDGFGDHPPPGATGLDSQGHFARRAPVLGGAAGLLTLVHPDGSSTILRGTAGNTIPVTPAFKSVARRGTESSFTDLTVHGSAIRVLATGVGRRGALVAALPLKDVNRALADQLLLLVLIAAGGIALAALLGLLVARTALAPIARFTRQTEAIAARPDRLESERLEVSGGDELARLAQTFNRTLDTLERSVAAQRNLVADASHELRTPIATIRANLQLMADEQQLPPEERAALRRDVIEELDELTALVSDVVELARGTKPGGDLGDVRVDEIVRSAVDRTRRRAPQLTVESELEPTLVQGEGDRMARAVANLLDNAVKWSPAGATIEVALRGGELIVRDHGPGFEQEDLPYVFDRFHRARAARAKPGSGLGLAIVRQAAEAHGGFVAAANAPDGGALMRIGFGPASVPADDPVPDVVSS
jgi:two-component system, OmpR family, sensor histidine kinase MprB